jgi:hypothetical protein
MSLRCLLVLCAVLFSGCVSVPHQAYNKALHGEIKRIGLVKVSNPAEYSINLVNHPGAGFGLIGGLIAAGDNDSKSKTFTQQQVDKYIRLGPDLTEELSKSLIETGFEAILVDAGDKARTDYLKDYPSIECDAYLDATIKTAGYWAQFVSTPYLPTMFVSARLVEAKDKTVLYTATVFVTDGSVPTGAEQLYPDNAYAFQDFSSLKAAPERAADGLKGAATAIAKQIAKDLK